MLVHVPIPLDVLNSTQMKALWEPFIPSIVQRTRQSTEQVLKQIKDGSVELHLVWDNEEQKAHALAGTRIFLQGDDKVGQIIWATGFDREKWFSLISDLERYHKEHHGCIEMTAIARPGWKRDLQQHGYRVSHVLVEKRL